MDRQKVVDVVTSWVGAIKGDARHKAIIDAYNSIKPLPNGYKLKYTDHWCAGTISAAYHVAGLDVIFPASASCSDMINKAKKMGIWVEDDAYIPSPADAVLYDWDDGTNYATTDCKGAPEHVGCVQKVEGGYIYVVEGNMKKPSQVGTRKLKINGRYIRGFITPNFGDTKEPVKVVKENPGAARPLLKKGSTGSAVLELHKILRTKKYGVNPYNNVFDDLTEMCVKHFQAANKLEVDGIVGSKTWGALYK